jgi:hypothetical protein
MYFSPLLAFIQMKFLLSKHCDAQGIFAALLIQRTITLYNWAVSVPVGPTIYF